jgi:hypothetical protein
MERFTSPVSRFRSLGVTKAITSIEGTNDSDNGESNQTHHLMMNLVINGEYLDFFHCEIRLTREDLLSIKTCHIRV